ncbi:hypothetical protein WMY93_008253 [Mugilogobius chulae]|uniref:Secreted protein n=1 Tax=Mugilogobius chulae TaxID=88201 RepID=A0AAW0PIS4_9GOBI
MSTVLQPGIIYTRHHEGCLSSGARCWALLLLLLSHLTFDATVYLPPTLGRNHNTTYIESDNSTRCAHNSSSNESSYHKACIRRFRSMHPLVAVH